MRKRRALNSAHTVCRIGKSKQNSQTLQRSGHLSSECDAPAQETESLRRIPDSFKKIVVVKDYLKPFRDDIGIVYVGVEQFLLDESLLS